MDSYRKIELKGKGSYGSAMLVQHKIDRKFYIMKIIDASLFDLKQKENALNEVNTLKQLYHPCIIRYRESFVDKNRYLCIVMDYADEGNLEQKLKLSKSNNEYLSENLIVEWFSQLCLAVKYIHDKRVIHRDIKTQNIFLSKGEIRLGDFGIARSLMNSEDLCKTSIGTPYYISPEVCQRIPYDFKSDIWSLGCILYEMMALRHAFDAKTMEGLFIKIIRGNYPPIPNHYSDELKELLGRILVVDPKNRMNIDDILECKLIKKSLKIYFEKQQKPKIQCQSLTCEDKKNNHLIKYFSEQKIEESIADQIERLRMEVEEEIGLDKLIKIYDQIVLQLI